MQSTRQVPKPSEELTHAFSVARVDHAIETLSAEQLSAVYRQMSAWVGRGELPMVDAVIEICDSVKDKFGAMPLGVRRDQFNELLDFVSNFPPSAGTKAAANHPLRLVPEK